MSQVTVVIPSIPPRAALLQRALASVAAQTVPVDAIAIAVDNHHQGAGPTRNRAIAMAQTEWLVFLDDDDELLPNYVERVLDWQSQTGADLVHPYFEVVGGTNPFPWSRGLEWNPMAPHIVPITILVRAELAKQARFADTATGVWDHDDECFWQTIHQLGGTFSHCPDILWRWFHHGYGTQGTPGNTSGQGDRW